MNQPEVEEGLDSITYKWDDLGIKVVAERYSDDGSSELRFYSNDNKNLLLHTTKINLMTTSSMVTLENRLKKNAEKIPWHNVLAYITGKTVEIARRGEPYQEILPDDEEELAPEYLLKPLLYQNHPNIIFGDYGIGKGLLAIAIAYIIQLPLQNNKLNLLTRQEPSPTLYCDWEDDVSNFRRRWSAFERGFSKGAMPIIYQRMTSPLIEAVRPLRNVINEKGIKFIIIDSLGPAARGNLNDPEPAIKYHSALRQLNVTSLTLAHTAKDPQTKSRSIFGSVFFTNLARLVWDCHSDKEIEEDEITVRLKNIKANLSRINPSLCFKFLFGDRSISVESRRIEDTSFKSELKLSTMIKYTLKNGSMSIKEIAEELEKDSDSVGVTIRRMLKKEEVVKLADNTWGLRLL